MVPNLNPGLFIFDFNARVMINNGGWGGFYQWKTLDSGVVKYLCYDSVFIMFFSSVRASVLLLLPLDVYWHFTLAFIIRTRTGLSNFLQSQCFFFIQWVIFPPTVQRTMFRNWTLAMEGKGPYRIYDPGGSEVRAREEAAGGCSYRQLLEENSILRERMKGLKSLGRFPKAKWLS